MNIGDYVRKKGTRDPRWTGTIVELDVESWVFGNNEPFAIIERADGSVWSTFSDHLTTDTP